MSPNNMPEPMGNPASLPPVAAAVQAAAPMPPAQTPTAIGSSAAQAAVAQAKQLVAQYQHDPYRLSLALQQLKAGYQAQEFGVAPNVAEN